MIDIITSEGIRIKMIELKEVEKIYNKFKRLKQITKDYIVAKKGKGLKSNKTIDKIS